MDPKRSHARAASAAVCTVAAALTLVACGGSGSHHTTGSNAAGSSDRIAFSKCMRTHGFPGFPDVQPGGGLPIEHTDNGGAEIIVNGVGQPVSAPALQAALGKCGRYIVSLFGSAVSNSQVVRINQALLQNAECMRSHGVPQFPDPVFPGSGHTGHMSPTARAREAGVNIDSPAFKAAVKTCGRILSAAMNGSRP